MCLRVPSGLVAVLPVRKSASKKSICPTATLYKSPTINGILVFLVKSFEPSLFPSCSTSIPVTTFAPFSYFPTFVYKFLSFAPLLSPLKYVYVYKTFVPSFN